MKTYSKSIILFLFLGFFLSSTDIVLGQDPYCEDCWQDDGEDTDPWELDEVCIGCDDEEDWDLEDSGDCSDIFSSAYPCDYEDSGDCTDPSSFMYPCLDDDECDSSSPYYLGDCECYGENCDDDNETCTEANKKTWYIDGDGDGFGDDSDTVRACDQPVGYVNKGGDCDDTDPLVWKSASGLLGGLGVGETIVLGERGVNENNLQLGTDEQSSFGTQINPTLPQNIEAFRNAPTSGIEIDLNPFNGGDFGIHQSTVNLFELSDAVLEDYMRDTFELTGAIANTDGGNSLDLIMNHFLNGTSGVLNNGIISDMLTSGDGSTNNFSQTVGDLIESIRTTICNELTDDCIGDVIDFSNNFTPDFPNSDPILKAQLGGTQGLSIDVDNDGVVGINIYDTFGVDEADTIVTNGFFEETFQDVALGTRGLRAMWVLQHQRGAKPFVHKVRLNLESMGINEININDCN